MKTRHIILIAATAFIGAGVYAQDAATEGKPRGRHPDPEAMKAHRAQIMAIYDENKDGTLDEVERAVLHDDMKAGKVERPGGGRGPGGPGGPGPRGPKGPPPEIVAAYDADGNGVLDATEHAQVRADIESGKLTPPGRGQGKGPGRGLGGRRGPGAQPTPES